MRRTLAILVTAGALAASTSVGLAVVSATSSPSFGPACAATSSTAPTVTRELDPADVVLDETVIVTPRIEVTRELQPGDTFTCELMVRNRHSDTATFQLEPNGVLGSHLPNAGYEFVGADDDRFADTAGPWLDPLVDEVTIPSRGVAYVPVTITVPDDPPVGSAYGSVNVVSRARADAGDTVVGIESQAATVLLLPIGGEGEPDLQLVDVDAPRLRWNRDEWPVTGSIDNDGTLHAAAGGRVRITSLLGNTVAELPIRRETILPGGREPLAVTWGGVPWFGIYRYDVRIATAPGEPSSVDTADGWFVALPPWWVLALLVAFIVWRIVARVRRRRAVRADWSEHDDEDDDDYYEDDPRRTTIVT